MTSRQTWHGIGQPNTTAKPRVRRVDHDDLFAGIEFTHSSGERVSASFSILAWVHAPKEMLDRTKIVLTRGYFTMVGPDLAMQRKKRKKHETACLEAYGATKLRNLKRPKVIEMDDDFAIVEFTQANGERVSAEYRRSGWVIAPGFVIAEVQKALARGFRTVMGPQPIKSQQAESRPVAHLQSSEVMQKTQPEKIRYLASRERQKQFARDFGNELVISFPWAR